MLHPLFLHERLPVPLARTVLAAAFQDALHLVGLHPTTHEALHFALDAGGATLIEPAALPLSFVFGLAATPDSLIVVGSVAPDDHPRVVALDVDGQILWQAEMSRPAALTTWPAPVAVGGKVTLVWQSGSTLYLAPVSPGTIETPATFDLSGGETRALAAGAAPGGILVAHSLSARLELAFFQDGVLAAATSLAAQGTPLHPQVITQAGQSGVLWLDGDVWLQWLDDSFAPLGERTALVTRAAPFKPRDFHVIAAADGRWALSCQETAPAIGPIVERPPHGPHRRASAVRVAHSLAVYDATRGHLCDPYRIEDPGDVYYSGAWLDGVLLLIHGSAGPFLSAFVPE
jgi:hypothetical protein